ncbi:MAG: NAD-dependent epimerase/dehydratase family protein [Pseudomonadota bacterium]
MKILVTGTEGYIGSLLAPILIERGHEVVGIDNGYYRDGWLYSRLTSTPIQPMTITKDLRNIQRSDLEGFDAVVHLAELSNDPLGQNNPEVTHKVNHLGSVNIAKLCKEVGIQRFVYTSSCSVYGAGTTDFLDETSAVNPQTAYAECKIKVENDVSKLADDTFSPVFLRNGTAHGASPRMRFDIVLNDLSGKAWTEKHIAMLSDGTPWRPLVHVLDICKAIYCSLEAPIDAIHNQIFNVGNSEANYQVKEIGEIVSNTFPGCNITFGDSTGDNRSYRVNFEKITNGLPGFSCDWNAQRGAEQLLDIFKQINMSEEVYKAKPFTRLKQLEYLIATQQIDSEFFWRY